ncbi:Hsp20/alpha crystallin family protein [Candidatus Nitrospira bockiana]
MALPTYAFDVDKFLNEALRVTTSWAPACNSYEDERGFWIQVALPGMDRKDVEIIVEDDVLTIKGERKDESAENRTYFAHEIPSGAFSRSFRLPNTVDQNRVSATFKDGVLTVELPKREEMKPRRIAIE